MNEPAGGFRWVGDTEIHRGYIVRFVEGAFVAPDGESFTRDIVRTPSAVSVVPVDRGSDGRWEVVLVRQYRAPLDLELLEIPAGMCDIAGEPAEVTAQRELGEETGYRARMLRPLVTYHPAAGFSDHRTTMFLGVGLDEVESGASGPEEQHMTVERIALLDAVALVESGEITDGKTIVGLLLARDRLDG